MCCSNRTRESWVLGLVFLGVIISFGVLVPMILITYPGDECLLFVSVRGEALIYGHPAGCHYITTAHSLVVVSSVFFTILFYLSRRRGPREAGSLSNKSLHGSIAGFSQASLGRAKVSQTLIIFSILLTIFIILTTIIIMSGYLVTCGELQYETRRQIYGKTTLGTNLKNVEMWCWSLYRDRDFHTRFHFDHYELSGQWHGQYTAYRHGRPQTWSGEHNHLIPIAPGLEFSMAMAVFSSIIWIAISFLLILLRRNLKKTNRREIAESLEDAKIWAADLGSISPPGSHQYEMLKKSRTDSLRKRQISGQSLMAPGAAAAADTQTLLEHQQVIAQTHPDGSYFLTPEGAYVQLVNGVLRTVDLGAQENVQYTQVQFDEQQHQHQHQHQLLLVQQQQLPAHLQEQQLLHQQMVQQQQLDQQMMQQQQLEQQMIHQQQLEQQMIHQQQLEQQMIHQQQLEHQRLLQQQQEQQRLHEQMMQQQQLEQQQRLHQQQMEQQRLLERQQLQQQQQEQLRLKKLEEERKEKEKLAELEEQLKVQELREKQREKKQLRELELQLRQQEKELEELEEQQRASQQRLLQQKIDQQMQQQQRQLEQLEQRKQEEQKLQKQADAQQQRLQQQKTQQTAQQHAQLQQELLGRFQQKGRRDESSEGWDDSKSSNKKNITSTATLDYSQRNQEIIKQMLLSSSSSLSSSTSTTATSNSSAGAAAAAVLGQRNANSRRPTASNGVPPAAAARPLSSDGSQQNPDSGAYKKDGEEEEKRNSKILEMKIHLSSRSNSPVPPPAVKKQKEGEEGEEDGDMDQSTRMAMRIQHDLAKMAGIKCSQF